MAYETGTASGLNDLFDRLRAFLLAGDNASGALTASANPANTNTVTIGSRTYTFQTTLTNVAGNVLIGANAAASLSNLIAAINAGAGAGTVYAAATTAHPDVDARPAPTGTAMIARARAVGAGGNAIATTRTGTAVAWGAAALAGGGARAWTSLLFDAAGRRMLLRAPGIPGTEQIEFGFDVNASVPTDTYSLGVWMFRAFNLNLSYLDQPGTSAKRHHLAWDSATPYWFVANGQRVIIVTKISTVYAVSYVGKFLPYGSPSEYPQPYIVAGQASTSIRFSTTNENVRNAFDPSPSTILVLHPDAQWRAGGNFQESGGNENALSSSSLFVYPFADGSLGGNPTRYRELRENVDGTIPLYACELLSNSPSIDSLGELDGIFACPAQGIATEDFAIEGGVPHLIVQNVYRTARFYYAAVRLL